MSMQQSVFIYLLELISVFHYRKRISIKLCNPLNCGISLGNHAQQTFKCVHENLSQIISSQSIIRCLESDGILALNV